MNRTQRILAGLLVLQLAVIALVRVPWGRSAGSTGPIAPELASITPAQIEVTGENGESVTLKRDGAAWTVASLGGYPADSTRVSGLLEKLRNLAGARPVVSSSRYHKALKVAGDLFERRIRIWDDPGGDPVVELYLGTSPGVQSVHLRRGGDDHVFEASGLSAFDAPARPDGWVERRLVSIPSDDVTFIEVENAGGRFALEKTGGEWRVVSPPRRAGRTAGASDVMALVRPFANLYIIAPVGPRAADHGLEPPVAKVTLRAAPVAGDTLGAPAAATVLIGAEKPDSGGERYASREGFAFTATISRATAERALDQKLDALLAR